MIKILFSSERPITFFPSPLFPPLHTFFLISLFACQKKVFCGWWLRFLEIFSSFLRFASHSMLFQFQPSECYSWFSQCGKKNFTRVLLFYTVIINLALPFPLIIQTYLCACVHAQISSKRFVILYCENNRQVLFFISIKHTDKQSD